MASRLIALVLRWLILALAVWAAAWLVPGIHLGGWESSLGVALVLSIFNLLLKPILVLFTLPILLLTLGLFVIIINTVLLLLTEWAVTNWTDFQFSIDGFGNALLGAIIISVVTFLVSLFIRPEGIARDITRR